MNTYQINTFADATRRNLLETSRKFIRFGTLKFLNACRLSKV